MNATVNPPPAGGQWTLRTGSSGTSYVSNTITAPGPYTLDLGIGAAATTGTYPIVVQFAGDGPVGISTNFNLMVSAAGVPGDYNGNNVVDSADYVVWRKNSGAMGTGTQATGDANGDMNVNQADYDLWRAAFGSNIPVDARAAAVPEPSSILPCLLGLICALMKWRRWRRYGTRLVAECIQRV